MKIIPINFPSQYKFNDIIVEYKDFKELGQGGPEIAKLFINKEPFLENKKFSGPLLYEEQKNRIILPVLHQGFCYKAFKFMIIDLKTKEYKVINKKEKLILLKGIDDRGNILYFNNLENSDLRQVKI